MQCFKLDNGSAFGVVREQEANCHMLCKQDTCRSSHALHNDGEGATSSSLQLREVLAFILGSKIIVYTDNETLKYLISKKETKP